MESAPSRSTSAPTPSGIPAPPGLRIKVAHSAMQRRAVARRQPAQHELGQAAGNGRVEWVGIVRQPSVRRRWVAAHLLHLLRGGGRSRPVAQLLGTRGRGPPRSSNQPLSAFSRLRSARSNRPVVHLLRSLRVAARLKLVPAFVSVHVRVHHLPVDFFAVGVDVCRSSAATHRRIAARPTAIARCQSPKSPARACCGWTSLRSGAPRP